jgi:Leu/Phe-tRNA-protein transferase
LEWRNIKTIISQVADETLGNYKAFTQNKKLKMWEDEIKLISQQENLAYKRYLQKKLRQYNISVGESLTQKK